MNVLCLNERMLIRGLLIIVSIFFLQQLTAQTSEDVSFSLLTVGPGDQTYNIFGHTALRMHPDKAGRDVVFNYGTFDPTMDYFVPKFLRGKLPYRLSLQRYARFLESNHVEGRAVWEQQLNLDGETKTKLIKFLENNSLPENREYLYDFFWDNCSTRLRDLFENELPDFQYLGLEEREVTFRQLLDEYLGGLDWTDLGIDLIIGSTADVNADHRAQMFLPDYLHDLAFKMNYNKEGVSAPLVQSSEKVLALDRKVHQSMLITPMYCFLFFLFIELILFISAPAQHWGLVRLYDTFCYGLISIISVVVLFMWFGTDHQACAENYNLLWANPLYLIVFVSAWRKQISNKALALCTIFMILVLLLWTFIPQQFHSAVIPIILIYILKNIRRIRSRNLTIVQETDNRIS